VVRRHSLTAANRLIVFSPATCKALAIPELLEHILLRLDIKTLHIAQGVCKDWHKALESKHLQKRMFQIHDEG
jgi:hypothetical protein